MSDPWISPGQAANEAFEIGIKAAAVAVLAGLAILYFAGVVSSIPELTTFILFLPVYFILVAALLSKWLGLNPDATDLRPVRKKQDAQTHRNR